MIDLKKQFKKETGMTWVNSQNEPDIDYVAWLEKLVNQYKPELFSPDRKPIYEKDLAGNIEPFSVDVCIIDEKGVHGLAYFNFDTDEWSFHTDTLVDYNEEGAETKWWWYYPLVTKDSLPK